MRCQSQIENVNIAFNQHYHYTHQRTSASTPTPTSTSTPTCSFLDVPSLVLSRSLFSSATIWLRVAGKKGLEHMTLSDTIFYLQNKNISWYVVFGSSRSCSKNLFLYYVLLVFAESTPLSNGLLLHRLGYSPNPLGKIWHCVEFVISTKYLLQKTSLNFRSKSYFVNPISHEGYSPSLRLYFAIK